jgi:serine/threonine protein phosphatase PrpC
MRHALLLGREHVELGAMTAIGEGPAAIALSRGGAAKTYSHVEPNEDAALFAIGSHGLLAGVADGHHGSLAAELALQCRLDPFAGTWTDASLGSSTEADWIEAALSAISQANQVILDEARAKKLPPSHTTLSFALVRPNDDFVLCASIGDSHLFRVGVDSVEDCGYAALVSGEQANAKARIHFLGYERPEDDIYASICEVHCRPLGGTRAIVLATDGLSELGIGVEDPLGAVQSSAGVADALPEDRRALEVCKALTDSAINAHRQNRAGDNIATAVLWLETDASSD